MALETCPVKFEAHDGEDLYFIITAFDEGGAELEMKTVVNVDNWDEISAAIKECLVHMKLNE